MEFIAVYRRISLDSNRYVKIRLYLAVMIDYRGLAL